MPLSEDQPDFIGYCVCNSPIYRYGEQTQYTCDEYPCYPRDIEEGEDEAEEREAIIKTTIADIKEGEDEKRILPRKSF